MKYKIYTFIVIIIAILINCTSIKATETEQYTLMEDIDYTETIENIKNPERGFYSTAFLKLMPEGSKPTNSGANLVHLRVDIGNFSKAVNGIEDMEFTEDALNSLDETFSNIRKKGGSVIIRFAYDGFNGKANLEPSLEMILTHISQLKPVFEKNKDVLAYVELGFFGPWGEMHTSKVSSTENVSKAIDLMLDVVPENIKIGVRTPNYYAKWLGIERSTLNKNITKKGTDAYRVGLFNDGYLGSESDLGTFANREIEVEWLENQAKHTFYGGEVVANYASKTPLNTVEYMSKEAFKTHTTYINSEWNYNVINEWKNEIYKGEDELYYGKDGYTYIQNHLGYRFVLRKSEIVDKIEANDTIKIKLQIENVGFANLINDKKVTLILEKDGNTYELPTEIDATTWNSKEISNVSIEVSLPENIDLGTWNIYLRISQEGNMSEDNNYKCIQFANSDIWNDTFAANYIGKVEISEIKQNTEIQDSEENKPNNDQTENDQTENDQPENNESENNQPENSQPENSKPENNQTEDNKPENDKTENNKPESNNKPENSKPENTKPNNNQLDKKQPENKKDTTTSPNILPQTGDSNSVKILLMVISIITSIIIFNYIKKII